MIFYIMFYTSRYIFLIFLIVCQCLPVSRLARLSPVDNSDYFPPSFVSHGPRLIMFKYNDHFVTLECIAKGNPKVRYSWKKGSYPLDMTHLKHVVQVKGLLNITNPSARDEGSYQCFASNKYGTAVSDIMQLKMAYQNLPSRFEEPRIHRPLLGSALTLRCKTPNSYPRPEIFWVRPEIGGSGERIEMSDRVFQDGRGHLHFANIQLEDAGNYTCIVTNPFLRSFVQGEDQVIEVNEDSGDAPFSHRLVWSTLTKPVALIGQTLSLKCFFSGYPTPRVDWLRIANKSRGAVKSFGHKFEIETIAYEDQGLYKCSSTVGSSSLSQVFNLTIEAYPKWAHESMVDVVVDEESPAVVMCDVVGFPKPDIRWFINGRRLKDFPRSRKRVVGYNYINYVNASQMENQVIQCNASNRHGYIFSNAFIKVIAQAPKFKIQLPPVKKISHGSTTTMTCDVISSPKAEFGWYKTPNDLKDKDYSKYNLVHNISTGGNKNECVNRIDSEHENGDENDDINKKVFFNSRQEASQKILYPISQENDTTANLSENYFIKRLRTYQDNQTIRDVGGVYDNNCTNACNNTSENNCSSDDHNLNCSITSIKFCDEMDDDDDAYDYHDDAKNLYIIIGELNPQFNISIDILDFRDFDFNIKHFIPSPTPRELVIKNVDFHDSGFYHCHAENKFGTNTTSTLLIVTEKTVITTKPSDKIVNAGKSVEIICRAETDKREQSNLVIRWYRIISNESTQNSNGRSSLNGLFRDKRKKILLDKMNERIYLTDYSLIYKKVMVSDTGQFLCHATNGIDFDEALVHLTVRDKPSAPKNVTITLCSDSSASLTWEKAEENNSPILKYHVYCYQETNFKQTHHPITDDEQNDSPTLFIGPAQYFYRCALLDDPEFLESKKISVTLSLTPFASHRFKVSAVNALGEGLRVQTNQSCVTPPSRPFRNPIGVCTDLRNCSQLVIVWQPLQKNEMNADNFYYLVSYQQINNPTIYEFGDTILTEIDQLYFNQTMDNKSFNNNFTFDQSAPSYTSKGADAIFQVKGNWKSSELVIPMPDCSFKRYLVYVQSVNEMGFALTEDIDMKIGYSGEGKPSVIPKNLRINHEKLISNYVELFWDPVESDPMAIKGIFKGYQIHAWMTEDPSIVRIQDVILCRDISSLACSSSSVLKQDILKSDLLETGVIRDQAPVKFILSDLWPNTLVTLGILVMSQTHKGDLSDTIKFMTLDAPPTTKTRPITFDRDDGDIDGYNLEITDGYEFLDSTSPSSDVISKVPHTPLRSYPIKTNRSLDYFDNFTFIYDEDGDNKDLTTPPPPKREEYKRIPIGSPKLAKWFIGMSSAIGLLLILFIIVCIIKRRKGRRYLVHDREKTKGRELDWPNVKESKENVEGRRRFAIGRLIKKKSRTSQSIDSETSSLKEYEENGDMTTFLEDGSFIGQYCSKPILELPETEEPMTASVLATYI